MTDYTAKLKDLRRQIDRKKLLDEKLEQLNREKYVLESNIQPFEHRLDKALKNLEKLERGGLAGLFAGFGNKEEKLDNARLEYNKAKAEYNSAKLALDNLKSNIQKVWNESVSLNDSQRQYDNLMEEINRGVKEGRQLVSQQVLEEEIQIQRREKIKEIKTAIETGKETLIFIDTISQNGLTAATNIEAFKKQLYKFRTAVNRVEMMTSIDVEIRTGDFTPHIVNAALGRKGYDVPRLSDAVFNTESAKGNQSWGTNISDIAARKPTYLKNIERTITPKELLTNIGSTGYEIEQVIKQLEEKLEKM